MEKTIVVTKSPSDASYGISLGLARNQAHNVRVPVASVLPNGPADRAGIAAGDLVTAINGTSPARLTETLLRAVLESSQGSIAFTLLTGPTDFDSVASNGSAGVGISSSSTGSLAMSRSCYDMASSGSISASSTARRSKHSRRRGSAAASNTPTVSVEYVDDGQTDSVEDNPISAEVDAAEGDEAGPRIIRKGRRYTPDRAALATPSPKVVLKRGYSPVLTSTNASSPDLLSAARISGSSRSLQLAARSPISSPMYIREFDEDPIVDVLASGSPTTERQRRHQKQQRQLPQSSSSGGGIYATQPRRSLSKSSTPLQATPAAPICGPGDIDDDDEDGDAEAEGAVVATSASTSAAKPARAARSNSQEVAANRYQMKKQPHQQQQHYRQYYQHGQQQHSIASTPKVQKLKNVLGESPQSVTIVRQNGLFISEKLTTNFLQTPSTVSRLLQKSNTKFSKFSSFPTTSNVDAIDGAAADQTPVVKNALLKAGEQRQQMEQQQKVFSSNERRAQSVEGLDSRLGMSSPPPPPSVDDKQQDINAVFNITIERCPEGKVAASQLPCTFDANLRVDSSSSLTILPVAGSVASKDNSSPQQLYQQQQQQFTIAVGRDSLISYKRKKLRLGTVDWQVTFRHDDDDRCLKSLQERLHNFPKVRQLSQQQQQQQQQFMLLHSAATAGSLDDASGNSPKQSGLKLFKNFGDRLWRAKDAKQQQQQQPLHLVYNPPRSPEPPAVSAVASGSFGLPLHRCPKGSNGVPLIVQLCCRVIECGAIRREGIYRISGNSRNIEALEAELSKPVQDLNPNCELWLEYNVVASVLKRFLLQLPDPLIPAIYYNEFIVTQKLSDHRNRMLKLHRLLGVMEEHTDHPQHRCHRLTLQYLVNHLGLVSQYSAYNRMQFYNLAMVFAPSLFGQRTQENMLMHSALLIKLTKSIIQFRDWLFTDWEIADQCVPQLSEAEDEASANPTDTDTANPQQQQPPDPEADRRRVREVVHELMTEAKAVAAAAGDDDGSPPSRAAAAQPQYRERDIDAEIDRRLAAESAETAATSREELTATETTDEATDATDAEKDLTDGVEPELSDKQQQQQHDRLLQDVEQLSLTVERLSRESQSNLEHLRHERELVDDRLRKAEADLLDSNSGRLSNSQSSDRLPDPRPSSPDDVDVDLVDDSDHRQHIGKTAGAGRLVSDATV
ncbi:hypothetical protein BOX15_Mlig001889g1 [Macrostomum lignano]|uniref:Rho-GAP domain-containing protein n=2 Tax=Macrostomum lignano TaxID=282301 RepID=A0A267D9H3_9PLAT|nr:hypothetical protein BOX15_Mlig001889g1 [Macrostomum lignano]